MSELQLNLGIPNLRQIAMPKQDKGGGTFTTADFVRTAYDKSGKPALY